MVSKNDTETLTIERLAKVLSNVPMPLHKAFWRAMHFTRGKKITKETYSEKLNEFLGVK